MPKPSAGQVRWATARFGTGFKLLTLIQHTPKIHPSNSAIFC